MRIKIISDKLNHVTMIDGTVQRAPVGHVLTVKAIPDNWVGMVEIVAEEPDEPVALTNDAPVKRRGRPRNNG